jgi:hypothetical protein
MEARLQAVYDLPGVEKTESPHLVAAGVVAGRECVFVGTARQLLRVDLAAGVAEARAVEGIGEKFCDFTVGANGDCYLAAGNRVYRLDERLTVIGSTPPLEAGVGHVEAVDGGVLALRGSRENTSIYHPYLQDRPRTLVRYSADLVERWRVVLPGAFLPLIPLAAKKRDRFYLAAALENLSLIEVRGRLTSFRVHDISELRRRLHAPGVCYAFDDDAETFTGRRLEFTHGLLDASAHGPDDAVILLEFANGEKEPATRFVVCRYYGRLSGFHMASFVVAGMFFRIAALSGNRVAAVGKLESGQDMVVAVFQLPIVRPDALI